MRILFFLFVTYLNKKPAFFFMNTESSIGINLEFEDDFLSLKSNTGLDTRIQVNETEERIQKEQIENYFFTSSLLNNLTAEISLLDKLEIWNLYNQDYISTNILAGGLLDDWLYPSF